MARPTTAGFLLGGGVMKSAVFFERDGVLTLPRIERGHQVIPLSLDAFRVNLAMAEPLRQLRADGFILIGTTNQPGLSRGDLNRRDLDAMHSQLRAKLPLDDILVCPHEDSDECNCRKPGVGMFREAGFKWQLDLERSYVVSDKGADAQAAQVLGCTSLLFRSPWTGRCHHDFILSDVSELVRRIRQVHSSGMLLMDQAL